MVGDGITDLEAVQESGGADMFVGFGGAPVLMAGGSFPECSECLAANARRVALDISHVRQPAFQPNRLRHDAQQCAGFSLLRTGIVERPVVKALADWFVTSLEALQDALPRYRVAMIGSGALLVGVNPEAVSR